MASKASVINKFYNVFWITFLDAPERCLANGFSMFCNVAKRHQLLMRNVMLFDTFPAQNAEMASKVSIFDRFHKVFCITFWDAPKRCVANVFPMFCKLLETIEDAFPGLYSSRSLPRPTPRSRPGPKLTPV